jgi:hypothetical protein
MFKGYLYYQTLRIKFTLLPILVPVAVFNPKHRKMAIGTAVVIFPLSRGARLSISITTGTFGFPDAYGTLHRCVSLRPL